MNCPDCKKNWKHAQGTKCSCGYIFVLDPKIDHITDKKFLSIIIAASNNDTLYFTEDQLYTMYSRKLRKSSIMLLIFLMMAFYSLYIVTKYFSAYNIFPFYLIIAIIIIMIISSTFLPTIITLLYDRVHEGGVFWGILCSMIIGLPIFSYGNLSEELFWMVSGSLFTVLCSGVVALTATYLTSRRQGGQTNR